MRNLVLLAIMGMVGCASSRGLDRVSPPLWQIVPEAQRASIEQKNGAEIAVATEEQSAAEAALADARRALERRSSEPRMSSPEQRKAFERVTSTQTAALRGRVEWRERLRAAAALHLATAQARLELDKAEAVALRNSDDRVDPAAFRGQFARFHQSWSAERGRATAARTRAEALDRDVLAAKAEYARICTAGAPATAADTAR